MHPNRFQDGTQKAFLTEDQMKVPKWRPGNKFYGRAIGILNVAFDNYYQAKTLIDACSDESHKTLMLKELEDSACEGFGAFGVDDLDEAFQHISESGGDWTDTNEASYSGKFQEKLGGPCMDVPKAACTYLSSVESKMKQLTSIFSSFSDDAGKIAGAIDTSNWALIKVGLENMKSNGEKAKKFMWFAPSQVTEVLGKPLDKACSFVGALVDIDTAVRDIDKLKQAGLNNEAAAALKVTEFVVKKVPVLGAFYSKIISELPDFFLNMKEMFETRQKKILSYAQAK